MSLEASKWAYDQEIKPSSAKFILVVLADNVQSDWLSWPSVAEICRKTGQDRKTVMIGLDKLEASKYVEDTGNRKGTTGQVKVYRLNFERSNSTVFPSKSTKSGTIKEPETVPEISIKSAENGTATEGITVPFSPDKSTVFPGNSTVFPPKSAENGTRNSKNSENSKGTVNQKQRLDIEFVLPDWIPEKSWNGYLEMRKKKKKEPTPHARDLVVKELYKFRAAGHDLAEILDRSTRNCWTDVFAPKPEAKARASPAASRHSGFDTMDYSEGIENGRIV